MLFLFPCRSAAVLLAIPFDDRNGTARNYSIIICEGVSYVPSHKYNVKEKPNLPTWQQVGCGDDNY